MSGPIRIMGITDIMDMDRITGTAIGTIEAGEASGMIEGMTEATREATGGNKNSEKSIRPGEMR